MVESELFKKLVEQEKRIDAVISRKRVEAFDAAKRPHRVWGVDLIGW